jgi:thioredoxin-like negative regulator of GroEL
MKFIKYLALGLIVFAAACKQPEKQITKEQALEFASSIGKSIYKKDKSFFNDAFDAAMLVSRIKAADPDKPSDYWRGIRQQVGASLDFGDKVIAALGEKGTYNLVKQYEKDGKQHLIFRMFSTEGFNYHDFELAGKDKKVKIADIYIYITGEYFSETLKTLYAEMVDLKDENAMYKASQLNRVRKLLQNGQNEKAKEIIDALPLNLQMLKVVQIYNIQVCSQISDSLQTDAIDKFQRDFPGDPSLDLVLINGYFLKKKYDEALACVNRLDKQINTDPFLDYYRGLIYNMQGKTAEAQQSLERLYKNLPDFSQGAIELCTYYMDKNEYEKAAGIVNKIKQNRDYSEASVQNLCLLYPKLNQYLKD